MNVLYCLPFWPYLYTPWLFREMRWMRGRGHGLAVVSLGDPPGPAADLKAFGLQDLPILRVHTQYRNDRELLRTVATMPLGAWRARPTRSLGELRRTAGLRQGFHEWATIKRVVAFVRQQRIDVIEAHWAAHSAMMAREISFATAIPYAVRLHGGDLHKNPSPDLQKIVESAAAVCPVSRFIQDLLLGERPFAHLPVVPRVSFDLTKLRICHNGVPGDSIETQPAPQRDDVQVVGTIGRLDGEKHHSDLIEAIARLRDKHPGLRLKIIGGGVLENDLKAQAAALGVGDRVEITGALPWEQVIEHRGQVHIYAHVSQMEGCSLAVAEGMARGVPALLTRVGAAVDSIEEGVNGYTVNVGDVPAIADRLDELVSAGAATRTEMGRTSLAIIRLRFQFETQMERIESILSAIRGGLSLPS
jgi:glycosyltransferase involved in cell wall biosynthesis